MNGSWLPLLEILLIAAVVFGFGFRELYLLRKDRRAREAARRDRPAD